MACCEASSLVTKLQVATMNQQLISQSGFDMQLCVSHFSYETPKPNSQNNCEFMIATSNLSIREGSTGPQSQVYHYPISN